MDKMDDFREAVRERVPELSKRQVEAVTSAFWDAIVEHVVANGKLSVRKFGTFRHVKRPRRVTRNPRTGELKARPKDSTIKLSLRRPLK